jgi:hypothetical protein
MTEALTVITEQFHGIPVRVVRKEIEGMIPLNDIADGIGLDRSGLHKLLKRNNVILSPYVGMVNMSSPSGAQETICLSRDGVVGILMKTDFGKMKDPVKQAKVIDFQRWAIDTLAKIVRGEPVQPSAPGLDNEILHARSLAEKCGKNPDAFLAIALETCGEGKYAPALLQTPPVVRGEPGWYNITQLVTLCNDPLLNPERLNHYLKNRGFQYRDENRLWRLTPDGMEHGKEYPYTSPHQHSEIRISWRESVLYASGLKRPMPADQMALARV